MLQAIHIYMSHRPNWLYLTLFALGLLYSALSQAWIIYWYLPFILLPMIPFIEYFTHKYILHMPRPSDADKHPRWNLLADRIHYMHHQQPKKTEHIFAEWWMTLPLLGVYLLLTYVITASVAITLYFNTLVIAYFLIYEWTHFIAHFDGYTPRTAYGRFMKKFHLWHHYKNEDYWYGITSPIADWVFRKWPQPQSIEASELALKNRGRR